MNKRSVWLCCLLLTAALAEPVWAQDPNPPIFGQPPKVNRDSAYKSDMAEVIQAYCAGTCAGHSGECSPDQEKICRSTAVTLKDATSDCTDPSSACYRSYFQRRADIKADPCAMPSPLPQTESAAELSKACGVAKARAAGGVGAIILGGVQEFLISRAKEEAITYAFEQLEQSLCKGELKGFFPKSCEVLEVKDFEDDYFALRKLRDALLVDVTRLPSVVVKRIRTDAPTTLHDNDRTWLIVAQGSVDAFGAIAAKRIGRGVSKLTAEEIARGWAEETRKAYASASHKVSCTFSATGKIDSACLGLLLPELAYSGAEYARKEQPSPQDLAVAVERAAARFCEHYGPDHTDKAGACLLGSTYPVWKETVGKLQQGTHELVLALLAASEQPSTDAALVDIAFALDAWSQVVADVEEQNKDFVVPTELPDVMKVASSSLRLAADGIRKDYAGLAIEFTALTVTVSRLAKIELPDEAVRSLALASEIASAKSNADVRAALDSYAEPLGSYKLKYQGDLTIALNAYVGAFAGYGEKFNFAAGATEDRNGAAVRPLTAPLGIDFSKSWCADTRWGLLAALIDPFAVGTIDQSGQAQDLAWGSIVSLGAFVHFAFGRSPFAVMAGGTVQPWARSTATCGGDACWEGAYQVGGALAVDIPLLYFKR